MSIITTDRATNEIERDYCTLTSLEHRKKFAQFFTPLPIADLMVKWLLGNPQLKEVLEPAFGLGIFSRALLNYKDDIDIKGFEIDPIIFDKAKSNLNGILKYFLQVLFL